MKHSTQILTLVAALIIIKRLLDGKPTCVHAGPFKLCNF